MSDDQALVLWASKAVQATLERVRRAVLAEYERRALELFEDKTEAAESCPTQLRSQLGRTAPTCRPAR